MKAGALRPLALGAALLVSLASCAPRRPAATAGARAPAVETADGLRLEFAENGAISGVSVGGKALELKGPGGFCLTEVLPPDGRRRAYGLVAGTVRPVRGGVRFRGRAGPGLELAATVTASEELEVEAQVRDTTGRDRALVLEFVLPLDLAGWTYENTPRQKLRIGKGTVYPGTAADWRSVNYFFAYPEKKRLTEYGRLPFNAVQNGAVGLSFGIPMSHPRIFLMRADPRGMVMRFSLGVSALTRKFRSRAGVRFIIFRSDPRWGIRSAAERYYAFFPELYATGADRHGNVCGIGRLTAGLPEKRDFGVSYVEHDFQWTDGKFDARYRSVNRDLGLSGRSWFHWREPWSWFHKVPRLVTAGEELALIRDLARGRREEAPPGSYTAHGQYCGAPLRLCAQAALNSYLEDERGKMLRVRHVYGCWMVAVNLDPELPRPNRAQIALDWQFRWLRRWSDPGWDGHRNIAWDSSTGWTGQYRMNFRREHFRYVDNPLSFSPVTGRLGQFKILHDWEFAGHHAALVRRKGGLVMANTSPQATLFYGQYMDVLVRESSPRIFGDQGIVMRMLIKGKPYAFYRAPEDAGGVRLAMFYAFGPGLGADDEKMRPAARKYMPVIRALGRAGWEPVTRARAPGLLVERFGAKPGKLFFTVRCQGQDRGERDGELRLDLAALGIDPAGVRVEEIAEGRPVKVEVDGKKLAARFRIGFEETLVFAVRRAVPARRAP